MLYGITTSLWVARAAATSVVRSDAANCTSLVENLKGYLNITINNLSLIATGVLSINGVINTASFCRVFASAPYPVNNSVKYEIWLPEADGYNGRFLSVGNGGMAGVIDQDALMENLNLGYAVAGGDGGHRAADNNNGTGAPGTYLPYLHDADQALAWIHNSVAYFTPPAKRLVQIYYDELPKYTYYKGCSTGGAQGFALAQFHPELFDGIVAGSPGNGYSHLMMSFILGLHANQTLAAQNDSLTQEHLTLIGDAVVAECDELDGVKDGLIENPLRCDFDIATLTCAANQNTSTCLSDLQIDAIKTIYAGPHDARTNASLYPGMGISSELGWTELLGVLAEKFSIPILQNLVMNNLSYDATTFNWASDVDLVNEKAGRFIDEVSPDLSAFRARGGKLIVTQGWSDPLNAAKWPLEHLYQIKDNFGGDVSEWLEVFMVPGGGHCGFGYYPQTPTKWHSLEKLVQWAEAGERPAEMFSSDPADGTNRTRKLCPWPETAKYVGNDPDDWNSYNCSIET